MAKLRIYDTSLTFKGEVDNWDTLIVLRKYRGIGTIEVSIPTANQNVSEFKEHYIMTYGDKKVGEIEYDKTELKSDIPTSRFKAYGFGKTMKKRITVPPVGNAYDRITSSSAETIVKTWFDNNLVSAVDTDRNIPYLSIAADQTRGTTLTEQTRYKLLNTEIERVLSVDDIGYKFEKDGTSIVFDVYEGVDRTANNGVNPPAIFSVAFDNILDEAFVRSVVDTLNYIYVGGQGEGAARTIVEVGTATSYERYERFLDARDTNDTTELTNRGLAAQVTSDNSIQIEIDVNANLVYETDFDLGDLVTIQIPSLGVQFNQRITEVKETYKKGRPVKIEIVVGARFKEFIKNVSDNKNDITNLEVI